MVICLLLASHMEEKTWTKRFTSLISKNDKRRECQQETHQIHQVYQTGIRPTVPLVVGPVTAVRLPRTSLPKIWAENCNTCSPAMSYWHLNISCTLRTQVLVPVNGLYGLLFYVSCRPVVSMTPTRAVWQHWLFLFCFFAPGNRHLPTNPSDVLVQASLRAWGGKNLLNQRVEGVGMGVPDVKAPILGKLKSHNMSQLWG